MLISRKSEEQKSHGQEDALKPLLEKLEKLNFDLKTFREKIKGEEINKYSIEKLREELDAYINEYDKIKDEDMGLLMKDTNFERMPISAQILLISLEIQAFINRIAHKINNYDNKNLQKSYKKIQNEGEKIKESVITISSLVFTAFTFIQLNFVAFQNSKDYTVLDRIILFSGINLFIIIGIFTILTMIKTLLSSEYDQEKEQNLKKTIKVISLIFAIIFLFALGIKAFCGPNPEVVKLEENIRQKNEDLLKLEKKIFELKNEINEINKVAVSYEKIILKSEKIVLNLDVQFSEADDKLSELRKEIKLLLTELEEGWLRRSNYIEELKSEK